MKKTIFWFRRDLRLSDNPGLIQAAEKGAVLAIYIYNPKASGDSKIGQASRAWLYKSLELLNDSLDGKLNFYVGDPESVLVDIIERNNIESVHWGRLYDPEIIKSDRKIEKKLADLGVYCQSHEGYLLKEPQETVKNDGSPYLVFTPFYKNNYQSFDFLKPIAKAPNKDVFKSDKGSLGLQELNLNSDLANTLDLKDVGEKAANRRLNWFVESALEGYNKARDFAAQDRTSGLSPSFHFGEISPLQVCKRVIESKNASITDRQSFVREIAWREFCYSTLSFFPDVSHKNLQPKLDNFPWRDDQKHLEAWKKGMTGHPLVDAGMRQLLITGRMHNRVRMVVASFLVKNLRIHWTLGAAWFMDRLLDADLACNSFNWQWVAGCGLDAAPFFRIFNPVLQGEKFDTDGIYTWRFVPELKDLPVKYLFKPWMAPKKELNYPNPIVDLAKSREEALKSYLKGHK